MPTTAGRRDDRQPEKSGPAPKYLHTITVGESSQPHQLAPLIFPASARSMHRHGHGDQDRSSSLRCGRSVLTPALTRCRPHGGRKSAKPQVAKALTEPHPFRDDMCGVAQLLAYRTRFVVDVVPSDLK